MRQTRFCYVMLFSAQLYIMTLFCNCPGSSAYRAVGVMHPARCALLYNKLL